MKVLEFAFDSRDSGCANDYLPHNYPENSVAYTGTHDNETIAGWWKSITVKERKLARDYLCDNWTPDKDLYKCFISMVMRSSAKLCVIPMHCLLYTSFIRQILPSIVRCMPCALQGTVARSSLQNTVRNSAKNTHCFTRNIYT